MSRRILPPDIIYIEETLDKLSKLNYLDKNKCKDVISSRNYKQEYNNLQMELIGYCKAIDLKVEITSDTINVCNKVNVLYSTDL